MQWLAWLKDKATWIVVFTAITAVSSTYSAYKVHQMAAQPAKADVKPATTTATKGKR